MTSVRQDEQFKTFLSDTIKSNLDNQSLQDMIDYIAENFSPDEVFPIKELEEWAEENDYVKP